MLSSDLMNELETKPYTLSSFNTLTVRPLANQYKTYNHTSDKTKIQSQYSSRLEEAHVALAQFQGKTELTHNGTHYIFTDDKFNADNYKAQSPANEISKAYQKKDGDFPAQLTYILRIIDDFIHLKTKVIDKGDEMFPADAAVSFESEILQPFVEIAKDVIKSIKTISDNIIQKVKHEILHEDNPDLNSYDGYENQAEMLRLLEIE